jgi:hypothetical protein
MRRALDPVRVALLIAGLGLAGTLACRPGTPHEALPELAHGDEAAESEDHEAATVSHGRAEPGEADVHDEGTSGTHGEPADNSLLAAAVRGIPSAPAVGFQGPEGTPFFVALRTPEVGHFPCESCHIRPIGAKSTTLLQMHANRAEHQGAARIDCNACHNPSSPGALVLDCAECHEREGLRELMPSTTAHLTVRLSHPGGYLRNCFTCHSPENPGYLTLQDGSLASLDEAYRLCAGCHYTQADDWAGGAHGKRLGGWQSDQRVILSCTGCHNPHSPKFPIRRPVTFPKIARREAPR